MHAVLVSAGECTQYGPDVHCIERKVCGECPLGMQFCTRALMTYSRLSLLPCLSGAHIPPPHEHSHTSHRPCRPSRDLTLASAHLLANQVPHERLTHRIRRPSHLRSRTISELTSALRASPIRQIREPPIPHTTNLRDPLTAPRRYAPGSHPLVRSPSLRVARRLRAQIGSAPVARFSRRVLRRGRRCVLEIGRLPALRSIRGWARCSGVRCLLRD